MKRLSLSLCGCALLAGCGGKADKPVEVAVAPAPVAPPVTAPPPPVPEPPLPVPLKVASMDWHKVATDADRERLRT